jgi:hypothetical protein
MKFIIPLKDNNLEIDTAICRALLFLSFFVTFLYKNDANYLLNLLIGLVLLTAALFTKYLFLKLHIKKIVLLSVAAILIFAATYTFTFPLLLFLFGMLTNLIHKTPIIIIDAKEVRINKVLSNKSYDWQEFSNIILKDNLLTIDFENNKMLQLEIDAIAAGINEEALNTFCNTCLQR